MDPHFFNQKYYWLKICLIFFGTKSFWTNDVTTSLYQVLIQKPKCTWERSLTLALAQLVNLCFPLNTDQIQINFISIPYPVLEVTTLIDVFYSQWTPFNLYFPFNIYQLQIQINFIPTPYPVQEVYDLIEDCIHNKHLLIYVFH